MDMLQDKAWQAHVVQKLAGLGRPFGPFLSCEVFGYALKDLQRKVHDVDICTVHSKMWQQRPALKLFDMQQVKPTYPE